MKLIIILSNVSFACSFARSFALSSSIIPSFVSFISHNHNHNHNHSPSALKAYKGIDILSKASAATYDSQSSLLQTINDTMSPADKESLSSQLLDLDSSYPGGLLAYIEKARALLDAAVKGGNPFEGYTAMVPEGVDLSYKGGNLEKYEGAGLEVAKDTVFVLVAGGLGER